jgi:heptosyltransferase II
VPSPTAAKILIVAPNWIGDTLLAQPLFARLQRPGVVLDVIAPPWTAPVLRRMSEVTEVIEVPFRHGELKLALRWRIGRRLSERGYTEAIVLPNSFKSALIPFFAGIPLRTGFVGESRYGVLNVRHTLDARALPLMAERYAQLAEKPGEPVSRPLAKPRLSVDQANLLSEAGRLGLDRSKPVAVLCPGAEYGPAKRWPGSYFAQLARRLAARGIAVWTIGSENERAIGEEISRLSDGAAINLCGKTALASAIDLMSVAWLVISNDSGLMHVAAALGKPLIALYGSSSPEHTPPLSDLARIVRIEGLSCSPCGKRDCPLGHFRCMNELTPERVMREVEAIAL